MPADGHWGRALREYMRDKANMAYSAKVSTGMLHGSVCPTGGAANPALTIRALSSRPADRLIRGGADPATSPRTATPTTSPR